MKMEKLGLTMAQEVSLCVSHCCLFDLSGKKEGATSSRIHFVSSILFTLHASLNSERGGWYISSLLSFAPFYFLTIFLSLLRRTLQFGPGEFESFSQSNHAHSIESVKLRRRSFNSFALFHLKQLCEWSFFAS